VQNKNTFLISIWVQMSAESSSSSKSGF